MTIERQCEICEKPATIGTRDMFQAPNYETGWTEAEGGQVHFYCQKHHIPGGVQEVSMAAIYQMRAAKQ